MEAPESSMDSVGVITIVPGDNGLSEHLESLRKSGFELTAAPDFEQARIIINREGYRFRIVLIDANFEGAGAGTQWVQPISRKFRWLFFAAYGITPDPASLKLKTGKGNGPAFDTIETALGLPESASITRTNNGDLSQTELGDFVTKLLFEAQNNLAGFSSLPPYAEGKTRFYKEKAELLFSLSQTQQPWLLEADAHVFPLGAGGTPGGLLHELSKRSGTTSITSLQQALSAHHSLKPYHADAPVSVGKMEFQKLAVDGGPLSLNIILATSRPLEGEISISSAVQACLASIRAAAGLKACRTLVLPVIGSGDHELAAPSIVRGVIDEYDPDSPVGDLKHVIFTVRNNEDFEAIIDVDEAVRGQRLHNDLPTGPDRLQIKHEVDALADAIVLNKMNPPLVVAVLGGWGTGKSFVLHLLKERLRGIRCWDLSAKDIRKRFPYVGHPYIIQFDAWTYAKSNLWASLMQCIFFGLDEQLSLESLIGKDKLLAGVDIWRLIGGLTPEQRKVFEGDLGQEVLRDFDQWRLGEKTPKSLWEALEKRRSEELKKLDDAEKTLEKVQQEFNIQLSKKQKEFDSKLSKLETDYQERIANLDLNYNAEIEDKAINLAAAQADVERKVDKALAAQSVNDAWDLVESEIKAFFGKAIDEILKKIETPAAEAPPSINQLSNELGVLVKLYRGLTHSPLSMAFLAFAAVTLIVTVVFANTDNLSNWVDSTVLAGIMSFFATGFTALRKVNSWVVETQKIYNEKINIKRKNLAKEREKRIKIELQRREQNPTASEFSIIQLKNSIEKTKNDYRREKQNVLKFYEDQKEKAAKKVNQVKKELKSRKAEEIKELAEKVEELQQRAGITAQSTSFFDLVKERNQSGFYRGRLGLLHQVQLDLQELTDALLPIDGRDENLFPRGEPRVILIIDDLDRCPPDQVVAMLEAAQLLVKTRLFVVVLAMDVRYITRALEKKYLGILIANGKPSGLDYIEKIVQIPYRVPGIDPNVMRTFLSSQMTVVAKEAPQNDQETLATHTSDQDQPPAEQPDTPSDLPVFTAAPKAQRQDEMLPTRAQQFNEDDLNLLKDSCNAAEVSPRAARRMVNIFKLLKIIWFHRGLLKEPPVEVKKAMLMLLGLSSKYPVIMRVLLRNLENLYLQNDVGHKVFSQLLLECMETSAARDTRTYEYDQLACRITDPKFFIEDLKGDAVGIDNVRLVKSFSFVGEVTLEDENHEKEIDFPENQGINSSASPGGNQTPRLNGQ